MKITTFTGVLAVTFVVVGCNKSADAPSSPTAQAGTASSAASHPVLAVWQQGDKAAAVASFLTTDWGVHPLFAEGSILSLTETQLKALPETDRKAKADEMLPQLLTFRDLAKSVEQAGHDAAAKGDSVHARTHFQALKQCGTALEGSDYTFMLRQVGQAIQRLADKDLAE